MKRVFVQRNAENACVLAGDRIEYTEDSNFVKVFNGDKLIGMFDLFKIEAIYTTESKEKVG